MARPCTLALVTFIPHVGFKRTREIPGTRLDVNLLKLETTQPAITKMTWSWWSGNLINIYKIRGRFWKEFVVLFHFGIITMQRAFMIWSCELWWRGTSRIKLKTRYAEEERKLERSVPVWELTENFCLSEIFLFHGGWCCAEVGYVIFSGSIIAGFCKYPIFHDSYAGVRQPWQLT